jgi:hypothetical protein
MLDGLGIRRLRIDAKLDEPRIFGTGRDMVNRR